MRIVNKVFLIFVGVVAALVLSMSQVEAAEDEESYTYYLTQISESSGSWVSRLERSIYDIQSNCELCLVYLGEQNTFISGYSGNQVVQYGYYCVYIPSEKVIGSRSFNCKYDSVRYEGSRIYDSSNDVVSTISFDSLYDSSFSILQTTELVDTNMKIFDSLESVISYAESGDESGWLNKPDLEYDSNNSYFNSNLGYLQGVQYKNVTNTEEFPYQIYSRISWDTTTAIENAYVQIAADVTYKKNSKTYSESMVMFKDYGSVSYSDGSFTFLISAVADGLPDNSIVKKVDYYYVRLIKYDSVSSSFLYGGWTRIDTNKFTVDTIAYDSESDDYYIDTDSDSSYSDQMGIDGNYGTLNWGDFSSASADSFKWFFSMLKDLFDMMGSFPSMVKTVFSFLPSPYLNCLGLLLVAGVIMRILGR